MLNRLMHPRNKYKTPPDFRALAIKYPEFRKHAKQDLSGRVHFDFKDIEAIRALTTTLLKEDFGLEVEIPLTRLIPTLPLRLNYLLWIEDVLIHNNMTSSKKIMTGIDIGCGASCVYPLLASKQFNWRMLATELDKDSADIALSNVKKNCLQDKITVLPVREGVVLEGAVDPGTEFDFCVCNPPFFGSEEELQPEFVARSPARPEPRNARSGTVSELVFPGGEVAFVRNIIRDSLKLRNTIRVYSVMVGHKSSLTPLRTELTNAGVTQIGIGQFCQGHTTRWGIAWSFDPAVTFPNCDQPTSRKQMAPFSINSDMDVATAVAKLHQLMTNLKIKFSTLKNNGELNAMDIIAMENTWSNMRKKRRQEKFQSKSGQSNASNVVHSKEVNSGKPTIESGCERRTGKGEANGQGKSDAVNRLKDEKNITATENVGSKRERSDSESGDMQDSKRVKKDSCTAGGESLSCGRLDFEAGETPDSGGANEDSGVAEPLLCGSLVVCRKEAGCAVELSWQRGRGGRDAAHQVLQYFKNNLRNS